VRFTALKTLLYFFNTQLDFVIPFRSKWIPMYFHSGFHHYDVQLICYCNTPVKWLPQWFCLSMLKEWL